MDLFRKCMEPVEKTLRDAKMDKSNVHEVGGAILADMLTGRASAQQEPCQGLVVVLGVGTGTAPCHTLQEQALNCWLAAFKGCERSLDCSAAQGAGG